MRWRFVLLAAALLVCAREAHAAGGTLALTVDRTEVTTKLGHTFAFTTTFANRAATPSAALIAHLNVLSLRAGVYVDPEDWSSHRTRYLGTIQAHGSRTITWRVQAVNAGSFAAYVALVDQNGAPRPPTTTATVRISVADRKTLDSGGILPLALGLPALLGLAWIGLRLGRAR